MFSRDNSSPTHKSQGLTYLCVFVFIFISGMKEDDICELLKFERKMLRARISTLRNDKFIQVRLKMETGLDGKAQKVNYYFINYKVGLQTHVGRLVRRPTEA